jgi:uncharacterized phage protein (TIGR02218 family)
VKTIPGALATLYASGALTTAHALRVIRQDGQTFGFTSHDVDATISAVLYKSNPGLDATSVALSAGFNVDAMELTTLDDGTVFSRAEVLAGIWRNADFLLFTYNWASLSDGIDGVMAGTFGEAEMRQNTIVIELRGLQQLLQEPVGNVSTKNCRARLGDSKCRKDLTTFTKTGTLSHVTSAQVFRDTSRTEGADYFAEGTIEFDTGLYAGIPLKIKSYDSATDTFTLALPMIVAPTVGQTYTAIAGCQKRLAEDCFTKFNNVLNFQGEPHRPLLDALTKVAEPSV